VALSVLGSFLGAIPDEPSADCTRAFKPNGTKMALTADWIMRTEHVPLFEAAKMCGENQHTIKQKYRAGILGPAPDVRMDVSGIPLYHLASLLIIHEAEKRGLSFERILANMPTLAGAAYIRFQLSEIRAGRCDQRGGTSTL